MEKEKFTNNVVMQMEQDLSGEQLRKLQIVITMQFKRYRLEEDKNELVIYDQNSDISAYQQFFASKKIQGLADGTLDQYRRTIDLFIRKTNKSFTEVTTSDIRLFLANREYMDHLSNSSLIRERGIVCRFFNWLFREEFILKDPSTRIETIKKEKRLKKPFTELELERLRKACVTAKETAVIELLMSTTCRVTEFCRLHSDNVDEKGKSCTVIGKGNKEKVVYINPRAQVALMAYWYTKGITEGFLIQGRRKGDAMTDSGIQKIVKKVGERAGIEKVHPHRFRRTAATLALSRGMKLHKIMRILGHESMDTTLLYAMVNDAEVERDHSKFMT